MVVSSCRWRIDAGKLGVISPSIAARTAFAFLSSGNGADDRFRFEDLPDGHGDGVGWNIVPRSEPALLQIAGGGQASSELYNQVRRLSLKSAGGSLNAR